MRMLSKQTGPLSVGMLVTSFGTHFLGWALAGPPKCVAYLKRHATGSKKAT